MYRTHISEAENTRDYHRYFNNLRYLMLISKSIVSIKEAETNFAVRIYLLYLIENNFDEKYSYDWQELKSILFYCKYLSNLNTSESFTKKLRSPFCNTRLCLYLLSDSTLAERKAIFQKQQSPFATTLEKQTGELVYELYGITEEERLIIEKK